MLPTHDEIQIEFARRNFSRFVHYTMPEYQANWHHNLLCRKLQDWADGKIKRLMVTMPPRHGKSELCSRKLPAYILGKNPNANIIASSYSASLAEAMCRDVKKVIQSESFKRVFPDTILPSQKDTGYINKAEQFELVDKRGGYIGVGIGGGITGRGGNYIIIDDPIKNNEDADSPVYRRKLADWYDSTLYTRLEKDAPMLIIMTRWHEDDLAGRLLDVAEKKKDADKWECLNLPAIKVDDHCPDDPRKIGQALWADKYDLKRLKATKSTLIPRWWNSLYQQTPTPASGSIIKKEWLLYYSKLPTIVKKYISVDCSFTDSKDSDFVVIQVWGVSDNGNIYLLDEYRGQWSFTKTLDAVYRVAMHVGSYTALLIEKKANGDAIIDSLMKKVKRIVPINPKSSKYARFESVAPLIQQGKVHFPDENLKPWVADMIKEILYFPNGKNDDRVDALSQALWYINGKGSTYFFKTFDY